MLQVYIPKLHIAMGTVMTRDQGYKPPEPHLPLLHLNRRFIW